MLALFGGITLFTQGWIGDFSFENMVAGIFLFNDDDKEGQEISLWSLASELAGFKEKKNYLVLFQNNLELRPSGGYLGNFGILKIKRGKITSLGLHDTNIFDGFGKKQTEPPMPMKKYLGVNNWQMRDSNWSPDFAEAAQKAEYFYHLQGGKEEFDGIIGVNASALPALLDYTGPIYVDQLDKTFNSENVLKELEYEVEKGYVKRNIPQGERKLAFKILVREIMSEIDEQNFLEKTKLKDYLIRELNRKNIQVFLDDNKIQNWFEQKNWAGRVDSSENNQDYLMLVEANLGSKKSNYFIDREIEYFVDMNRKKPKVSLKINYFHSNSQKDWFNDDYGTYLKVYAPKGSWLLDARGVEDQTEFSEKFNKTVFGNWIKVPAGGRKIVEFEYLLPEEINSSEEAYNLLIQKQSGMNEELDIDFFLKTKEGELIEKQIKLKNTGVFEVKK